MHMTLQYEFDVWICFQLVFHERSLGFDLMHMRPFSQVSQYIVPSPQGGVSPASTLTPKVGQAKLEQNMGDISL